MESPFTTTSAILSERSNTFDDLRIIASDYDELSVADKTKIEGAADELETLQRGYALVYAQLIETQQKLIAANDRLIELHRKQPPQAKWSLSSGWVKVQQ